MKKIIVFLLCLLLPVFSFAETVRVYDSAGIFTQQEKEALEDAIREYRHTTKTDFAILTTDDYLGENMTKTIADNFYDSLGIGIGNYHDGMIFYIDMYNRAPCISTCGFAVTLFPDESINRLFDASHDLLSQGQYAAAMQAVIDTALAMHDEYWSQYIVD